MKVLLLGGGIGGYVYLVIVIVNKIRDEYLDVEIIFVGMEKGIELEIVFKYGFELKIVIV